MWYCTAKTRELPIFVQNETGVYRADTKAARYYFLVSEQESNQRNRRRGGTHAALPRDKLHKLWSACHRQATYFDSLRGAPPPLCTPPARIEKLRDVLTT